MDFKTLLQRHKGKDFVAPERLLCLDPGHTTGVALFVNGELSHCEQVATVIKTTLGTKLLWENLLDLFVRTNPTAVVCENYRVYQHKLKQHSNSSVETLRVIGGIDLLCGLGWEGHEPVPIKYQMASQAKGFVTDEKLKSWGMWQKGMRHSRDAVRHGCYYLLFDGRAVR